MWWYFCGAPWYAATWRIQAQIVSAAVEEDVDVVESYRFGNSPTTVVYD